MSIFRIKKHSNPYVILDKTCLDDTSLSWKAKGLHAYLIAKPDDWQVRITQLMNASPDGRESVRAGMRELVEAGYVERSPIRMENGTLQGQEWLVYESPINRTTGNPSDGEYDATKEGEELKKENTKRESAPDSPQPSLAPNSTPLPIRGETRSAPAHTAGGCGAPARPLGGPGKGIFVKPSLGDVAAYVKEIGGRTNPKGFLSYYESNGWKVGKNSMKDWRAAVRTWEIRNESENRTGSRHSEGLDTQLGKTVRAKVLNLETGKFE